jgi:hypothetical protein
MSTKHASVPNASFRAIKFLAFNLLLSVTLSPAWAEQRGDRADLTRLVVVGDSLSAGFQNHSLLDVQQVNGYASLVAKQARTTLPLPLIMAPGIPSVLTIVSIGPPLVIAPAPGTSGGRVDPFVQPLNLAVPLASVQDALTTRPNFPIDSITDLVLGLPGLLGGVSRSQVEWAENLAPTTIFVWIGSNDALGVISTGDVSILTSLNDFKAAYVAVSKRLAATGATLVFANIPDVTVVPYLTSAEKVAAQTHLPLSIVGPILGIKSGDFVTPDASPMIQAILTRTAAGPLPGNVVLDAAEVGIVRARIAGYNRIIADQARATEGALVDIHDLANELQAHGIEVGGQRLTTDYLGGLFSLDGVHPTNTGYAIFANAFIKALNRNFAAGIPPVSVEQIKNSDPLVFPKTDGAGEHDESH